MKHTIMLFLAGALFAGFTAELDAQKKTAPAKAAEVKSQTPAIMKKLNDAANRKNLAGAQAAFDELMKQSDVTPAQKAAAHYHLGRTMQAQKKADMAAVEAEYDKAMAIPEVSIDVKLAIIYNRADRAFRSNFPGGGIVYTEDGIIKALALNQEAAKLPGLTNMQKINASKRIANCLLELMKVEEAYAELEKAVKLSNLTWDEMYEAKINLANVYKRALEYDKADKLYREVLDSADKEKLHVHKLNFLYNTIAGRIAATQGEAAARAWLKSQPRTENLIRNREYSAREFDKFIKEHEATLKGTDPKKVRDRIGAINGLISIAIEKGDIAMMQDAVLKKGANVYKEDANAKNQIARRLRGASVGRHSMAGNLPMKLATIKLALALEPGDMKTLEEQLRVENLMHKHADAKATMETILKHEKVSASQKLYYQAHIAAIDGKDAKAVANKIKALVKNAADEKLRTDKELANVLLQAARTAHAMGKDAMAREMWNIRGEMLVNRPKPTLKVPFLKDAPQDITEFIAHPYIKDPKNLGVLDFKYGDNLEFLLLTDSAITGRTITESTGTEPTKFAAICDHNGVKILFIMPCAPERAAQLKQGYGGFGGFEMYLAMGFDQPYHCMLIDGPPRAKVWDDFNTQYNNKDFRVLKAYDNYRSSFKITDNCVYMLLELDWTLALNGIPTDGFIWEFEPIHWENRGRSWGGSVSVHNRSTFGHLIFTNMTPENRTAIKRSLLPKAKAAWNTEMSSRTGGVVEHWQDPDLGDVQFDKEVIAPFRAKYGAYAAAIKANMTDEEVNRIYDEAYDVLINTKFYVQQLRVDYLDKVLTEEE